MTYPTGDSPNLDQYLISDEELEYLDSEGAKAMVDAEAKQEASLCPACGVNREVVFQGMMEGYESDNAQYSIKIIKNCEACKKAYIKNRDELCELIP